MFLLFFFFFVGPLRRGQDVFEKKILKNVDFTTADDEFKTVCHVPINIYLPFF